MKQVIGGLLYAIGIVLAEILIIVAWYCSPLVIHFDASGIVLGTFFLLPVIAAYAANKHEENHLVERGFSLGVFLWCLLFIPICWTLPMLISKKLIVVSLVVYLTLSVGASLCTGNIQRLRILNKLLNKKGTPAENRSPQSPIESKQENL